MASSLQSAGEAASRLLGPGNALQLALVAVSVALTWWIVGRLRRRLGVTATAEVPEGLAGRLREGTWVVMPYAAALLILATADVLLHATPADTALLTVAVQLTGLLLLIRVAVYVLRVSLGARARLKGWGTLITLVLWVFASLHLLGWSRDVIELLDGIGIEAGHTRISAWSVMKLLVTVSVFVIVAIWTSRWLERRVLRVDALAPNMRIGIAKFTQAFLVGLAVLVGLNAAGLDLTTLNVLTGAVGIGLGFGLQAIAANFVSGFVLLMDRSIKPGDVISISGTQGTTTEGFGWVQELRGRYVVIRDRDGVETLVPNQHLITNPVINWSYTDPRVRLKLPVRVSYRSDPELAMRLLTQATQGHRRILQDPAPVARLMAFGENGIDLELRFWIPDPQEGVNNVRSDVNRAIWRLFREHGIEFPFPQREVRVAMVSPPAADLGPARDA
jgi:small-conductance mechanosensitive channel